jgi:uracil-DNA glycosylase
LTNVREVVVLGKIGYDATCRLFGVRPRPPFGHGVEVPEPGGRVILCSYHVSQQNTFTGKLTEDMLDGVFLRARELASATPSPRRFGDLRGDGPSGPLSGR